MNNNRFPGVKAEVFSILNLLNNCSQQSTIILFSLGPLSNTAIKRFVLHMNLSTYLARVLSDPQIPYQVSNSEQKPSNTNKENSYFHFKSRLPFSLGCQPTVYDFWQQLLLGRSNCKVIKTKNCNNKKQWFLMKSFLLPPGLLIAGFSPPLLLTEQGGGPHL